jgi:O-antigen chain-terminating methyltransferase
MGLDGADAPDVDALVEQLRAKVEQRRSEGVYPPGFEDDLDAHFRRIVAHRVTTDYNVHDKLAELEQLLPLKSDRIPLDSRMPGGTALHKTVAKVVSRQTQGILEQVQLFASSTLEVLRAVTAALEDPSAHLHADLVGQIDVVFERLSAYDRGSEGDSPAVRNLRSRIEQLEEAEAARRFRPTYSAERFEEEFRGSTADLKEAYRGLAQLLGKSSPVLDIGCGRGELLELFREMGIRASGVEIDPQLVADATARGLDVQLGDGLRVLSSLDEMSLGAITLMQVIEHLTPQQAVELVSLAFEKVRPGGKVIIETVNPQSLYVFAHAFYVDPTHTQPVHPAYLTFLFREAGFSEVSIDWRSMPSDGERLMDDPAGGIPAENVTRLTQLLFAPQDYAVIATR